MPRTRSMRATQSMTAPAFLAVPHSSSAATLVGLAGVNTALARAQRLLAFVHAHKGVLNQVHTLLYLAFYPGPCPGPCLGTLSRPSLTPPIPAAASTRSSAPAPPCSTAPSPP
jgi:hypothetical protein